MKKKLLPLAMLAGLAGVAGTAQAVHLNSDGLGQVLVYPFYSAVSGNDTYVTVVNTTNQAKAVKVRFLEGENSQEVLDFNLYLSPYDHWAGAITAADVKDAITGKTEAGAKLVTGDTSCTAPAIPRGQDGGVSFRNYAYAYVNDPANPGYQTESTDTDRTHERTREGYIEIIEMGVLGELDAAGDIVEYEGTSTDFGAAAAVTHANGEPADCTVVQKAWDPKGNWIVEAGRNIEAPTGGLYGYGTIINVEEGTSAAYDAIAVDNFNDVATNTATGSVLPSLANNVGYSDVLNGDTIVSTDFAAQIDALSSVFMRNTLSNDYVLDEVLNAETSWVVTFPTKRFYSSEPVLADRAPFSAEWDKATACEFIDLTYWDREEGTPTPEQIEEAGGDFSPLPPQFPTDPQPGFNLCTEVSIINFNNGVATSDVLGSDRLGVGLNLVEGFEHGWAQINFANAIPAGGNPAEYNLRQIEGDDVNSGVNTFVGLPVVGFAIQKFINGTLDNSNTLSNYFSLVNHKYTRDITTN